MSKLATLPAGHRAVSLENLDRLEAAASKSVGLMALLSAFAIRPELGNLFNRAEAEGVERLVSDLSGELEAAVEALAPTISTPNQEAA